MISAKMKSLVANGSVIRAMFEEGKKMAAIYGAENVYDFSLGNPCTPPPESVRKAAVEILMNEPEMMVHGYMSNTGYEDVRISVAQSLNRRFGTNFGPGNLVMTVGAAGGLNVALKTIMEPGDEVMLFAPYFGEYNNYISNFDGVPVVVPPNFADFSMNLAAAEPLFSPKTKAVIINSPNNPTGAVYTAAQVQQLADLLEAKSKEFGHTIYLISDEPYREIVYGDYEVPYLTKYYKNTFVGYSYSKSLSLPGERIGYLVIPSEMEGFEETVAAASVANRILGFVNAPSLFQRVIGRCADEVSDMSVYIENRNILCRELKAMGYEFMEPQGAFYMFPKSLEPNDKAFCAAAKEFRLLLVPGSTFAGPGHFRLAFCVSRATVENSLESFHQLAKKYK
ncbi:MAG: pyridoxal phosphate-dependent aminotransferase [Firmicutes bacterium]|nr:pyridoxal phosphate-dependent aminotransferase [Bacillota bacterium]